MSTRLVEGSEQHTTETPEKFAGSSRPRTSSRWTYRTMFKRWFDILFSLLFLPFALPFALLAAVLIRLDSRGPVLIKVKRLGKDGTTYYKYKFRTMVPNAENVLKTFLETDPEVREEYLRTYKIKNDPRITRFGKWLRFTSLDELPQVINVLKGEMSWVGPRDILDSELAKYGEFGQKFLTVQPGITGLWQVSGRSNLSYAERVRLDMRYIDTVSLLVDLQIIVRTMPVVLFGDGAS
jgi:exopolysaccharide production protein ExoY